MASALVIGRLGASVQGQVLENPIIPSELKAKINLNNVSFISNDRLRTALSRTSATPQQEEEAVRINTAARLRALRVCFLALAVLALLAFFPAAALPDWVDM